MLDESLVHISALRWIVNKGVAVLLCLLEEALSHSLIHDDEGHLGQRDFLLTTFKLSILFRDDLVQLLQLEINHLLSHGVTHTITVDEDVEGHLTLIVLTVALEGPHKVVRQDSR